MPSKFLGDPIAFILDNECDGGDDGHIIFIDLHCRRMKITNHKKHRDGFYNKDETLWYCGLYEYTVEVVD